MKKTYNSLKRNQQLDGQLFLEHFFGEWHSGITSYIQNRKVFDSNPTDALGHTVGNNVIKRLPVDFGSYLKWRCD